MGGANRVFRLAALAISVAPLAACGTSTPTQFFTLDAVAPGRPIGAAGGPALRVDHVTIPAVMDRPELVREYAADRLKVDDFSHWGAPLGELMRATLIEDLTVRLPAGRVIPAGTPKLDGGGELTIDITAIHEGAGDLTADIDWTLTQRPAPTGSQGASSNPPQVIRTLRHERIEAPLNGPSQQAFAAALSQVMGTLADRIAGTASPAD